MATLTGPAAAVRATLTSAGLPPGAQVLGPVPVDGGLERAMVRVPRYLGSALARALKGPPVCAPRARLRTWSV